MGHLRETFKSIYNVQHRSKQTVPFTFLMLHFNTLIAVHLGSLGNLKEPSWKHFYIIWASERNSASLGQSSSLSTCFMKWRVHMKLSYCCLRYCIFFPNYKLKVYLSCTQRWTRAHVTSARQPGNADSCPFSACKMHPLHSLSAWNTAVTPEPCARSYFA